MSYDVEKLAAVHLKIRDAREQLKKEFELKDKVLEDQLIAVNQVLLTICNETHTDSLKTKLGTVIKSVRTRFWTDDWEAMKQFAKEHDALDLFEKRLHQGNMSQFMVDNPGVVPVGLNATSKYEISVRKPARKS